ncbi:hypothetical protein KM043_011124 [Ampulex compressa]|nr:hypothetical protein KM043_011124 [Ampulex compressa]
MAVFLSFARNQRINDTVACWSRGQQTGRMNHASVSAFPQNPEAAEYSPRCTIDCPKWTSRSAKERQHQPTMHPRIPLSRCGGQGQPTHNYQTLEGAPAAAELV